MIERSCDTIVAAIIVILCSYWVLPVSTRDEAQLAIAEVRNTIKSLIEAIAANHLTETDYHQHVLSILQSNQRLWPEWIYENYFHLANRNLYQQVVRVSEHCLEILAALKWRLYAAPLDARLTLMELLEKTAQSFNSSIATTPHLDKQDCDTLPTQCQLYLLQLQKAAQQLQKLEQACSVTRVESGG